MEVKLFKSIKRKAQKRLNQIYETLSTRAFLASFSSLVVFFKFSKASFKELKACGLARTELFSVLNRRSNLEEISSIKSFLAY